MNGNNILAISSLVIRELYRRKDFYVLFILTVLITALAGSANFFNDPKIVGWLKELSLTLIWLSSLVIAINTAARQIPAERESRTIFPLLAKPVTRADVMAGKFLGCWLACGLALVVFYIFFGIVVSTKGGRLPG
jgi:Cu-processing system permease protein